MKKNICILGMIIIAFGSCYQEKNIVTSYIDQFSNSEETPQKIYVVLPESVIHTNRKLALIENFETLDESLQDKIIRENTLVVNKINDSIFLDQFNRNLVYNLRKLGIPVFVTDANQLPQAVPNEIFVIQIPQIELEENIEERSFRYMDDYFDTHESSVKINTIGVNVWFLFEKQTDSVQPQVYFCNWVSKDQITVSVIENANEGLQLHTSREEVNVNDAYSLSYKSGRLSATYFIEKILNDYLKSKKGDPSHHYFYDLKNNSVLNRVSIDDDIHTFEKIPMPTAQ